MYEDKRKVNHDFETGWYQEILPKAIEPLKTLLDEGIKGEGLSNAAYAHTYSVCYNLCTQKHPFNFSDDLYKHHGLVIVDYLSKTVVPSLHNKHDAYLLTEVCRRWSNHKIMNRWMKSFFMYLDRYYVQYHSLLKLNDAGLKHFKEIVYDELKKDVTNAVIVQINEEREKIDIDRSLLKNVVDLYVQMGVGSIEVYEADLEAPFLESTREYYARKADLWMTGDDTPSYLQKVEKVLADEQDRLINYLNNVTEMKLMNVVETELLGRKKMELLEKEGSGLKVLLEHEKIDDLSRMYQLFSRLKEEGLAPMADIFRLHVLESGMERINARAARLETLPDKERDKESTNDPAFIKDVIALHEKYLDMVRNQFGSHALFQKALKDAFTDFINRDAGESKHPEIMASFCDSLLKSGGEKLGDDEIEAYLEKIVLLFSYLSDKDVFAEIYRDMLAKRLLGQRSASDEMERTMVGKLKQRCGSQFTGKFEGMINDLVVGTDHKVQFEEYCVSKEKFAPGTEIDFGVQVLTTGYWPTYRGYDGLILPPIMARCVQVFSEFYTEETNHGTRRLQWIHSQGNAEVRAKLGKSRYELQVVSLQAMVLLMFHNVPYDTPLTYAQLKETINLPDEALKRILHSLACGKFKVLKKSGVTGKVNVDSDTFIGNEKFTNKSRKFRIPMASLDETKSPKKIEEDRGIAIEAAIVRIMKARKILRNQELQAEVLVQLAFFQPSVKAIRKHIEALIDREYLERDPEDRTKFHYLA
mmetsp:Transcript_9046/g.15294  ORF Transcript_9046/g.15294 Transcript_9046/m.15294 type:complete len:756 (-) Transcript_9046:308-2575(-)